MNTDCTGSLMRIEQLRGLGALGEQPLDLCRDKLSRRVRVFREQRLSGAPSAMAPSSSSS